MCQNTKTSPLETELTWQRRNHGPRPLQCWRTEDCLSRKHNFLFGITARFAPPFPIAVKGSGAVIAYPQGSSVWGWRAPCPRLGPGGLNNACFSLLSASPLLFDVLPDTPARCLLVPSRVHSISLPTEHFRLPGPSRISRGARRTFPG